MMGLTHVLNGSLKFGNNAVNRWGWSRLLPEEGQMRPLKSLKSLGVAVAALAITSAVLMADGLFPNFPIVGGASYCGGYSTGVNGQVCVVTVPAGPTALTGNETIIADTHLTQGQSPQTVAIDISTLGAGPYQYNAPLTGASITVLPGSRRLVLDPAGTIAALTVVFPAASLLTDGQLLGLCSTQIVTALTLTAGTSTTILNGPTALAVPPATGAGTCYEWVYRLSNTSWYRTQ